MTGIGFFAPLPLALMIPFMAGQSLAMGEAFGKGFQYGKRKISSMTNEDFNKMDFGQLSASIATDYRMLIPHLSQSVKDSNEFQRLIINEMANIVRTLPADIISGLTQQQNPLAPPPPTNQFTDDLPTPTPPPTNQKSVLKGIPAFLTPYIGPSGKLNDIASLPPSIVQQILQGPTQVPPQSDFYKNWVSIVNQAIAEQKRRDKLSLPPTHQGPQFNVPPVNNKIILDSNGNIISVNDTRQPVIKKLRAPTSIVQQHKKYLEEIRFLNSWLSKKFTGTQASNLRLVYLKRKDILIKLIQALELKYEL